MDKATRTRFEAKREARKERNRRTSVLRTTRISPQKARLVADQVRGLPVNRALDLLKFSDKKAAGLIYKVLFAAISNAETNAGDDVDELKVKTITVDEGPMLKRFMARAKGRGTRILKRTSHITANKWVIKYTPPASVLAFPKTGIPNGMQAKKNSQVTWLLI